MRMEFFFTAQLAALREAALRLTVLLAAVLVLADRAEAGFFEDLFGLGDAPASYPMTTGHRSARHRPKIEQALRHRGPQLHAKAPWPASMHAPPRLISASDALQPPRARFCRQADTVSKALDSTEALMQDATLRHGDVIVTDEGVRVFEGREACPHAVLDFRTLSEARDLDRGLRPALAGIDNALKAKGRSRVDLPIVATDPQSASGR
jgi:hypothetical protein